MPSYAEIQRALQGAWLLARGDTRGMMLFDLSVEGFWRSFAAALLAAPAYALVLLEQYAVLGGPENLGTAVVAEILAYACGWLAFPMAAIVLTRLLGLGARYVPLVVASNWGALLQIGLYTVVVIVSLTMPDELRKLGLFVATAAVLVYQWFVIRTALETSGGIAFGFVVIDVLLSVVVTRSIDGLLQPS
jgi:hypothetical protein